jgi:hypothetical protein
VFGGERLEVFAAQGELSVAIGVHAVAQHILHRQAVPAASRALAAHVAVVRPDLLPALGQQLLVGRREG